MQAKVVYWQNEAKMMNVSNLNGGCAKPLTLSDGQRRLIRLASGGHMADLAVSATADGTVAGRDFAPAQRRTARVDRMECASMREHYQGRSLALNIWLGRHAVGH
jgi:hypothetical protein